MSDNPPDDGEGLVPEFAILTDPVAQRRARDRQKREAQEADSLWRAIFNSKIGRREMWRLLQQDCGGFSPPFACGPNGFPQSDATWFGAGKYAIGQLLYQRWMKVTPEGLRLMHMENDPNHMKPRRMRRPSDDQGDTYG